MRHSVVSLEGEGQRAIILDVFEAAEVLRTVGSASLFVGLSLALRLVDAHGPPPAAWLAAVGARASRVALGLAVLVEVGLGIATPALPSVLGREKLGAFAVFGASLNVGRGYG